MAQDHFIDIYQHRAEAFHRMVMAEDCDGHLLPAIEAVLALRGIDLVEVGVGTGRLTGKLIQAGVGTIVGIERSPEMLQVAHRHLTASTQATASTGEPVTDWRLEIVDAANAPIPSGDNSVELVLAGWVFGHWMSWFEDSWQARLAHVLHEFSRVTHPGGTHIVVETLGTGSEHPAAPTPELAAYYRELEQRYGFQRVELSTDYLFDSVEHAVEACGFFFGEALVERIRRRGWARVPEWTGLWWRRL